ncbi:copper radical oxidase [Coprinopsis marcescibilis]|uniref:Copper radical oxidase n=1 Tax=Coprinopsis marcescibilis TaxID=230819 RepID=A0A5C3KAD8_COPMA|nr:copper radical oxidase [Coprinopsis marcescibilis]
MWTALLLGVATTPLIRAQQNTGQPLRTGNPGSFEIIGNSLVSAQQLFLGNANTVYFVDKVENNPTQINGHPAWGSEWSVTSNNQRAMDVMTNSFCAGGNVLGNGTWINVGGNQAVTYGGDAAASQDGGAPYDDPDGRQSIRLLDPCTDESCNWRMSPHQSDQRWYPTLETLEDGSIIIVGGCRNGGYVNDPGQDNPTYEFFPPSGDPINSPVLHRTLPVNLYPLLWLLPSGNILFQSGWETVVLDYKHNQERQLDNMPEAIRVYPASAGSIMLPLTPRNNYTATVLFCGGTDVPYDRWYAPDFIPLNEVPSTSCVSITPDVSGSYIHDDPLPEARSMLNLIQLPDGTVLGLNGAGTGTAGYGNNTWAIGQSYADDARLMPILYSPSAAAGHRWSSDGFSASTIPRMYHSSATLLADGSVMVSGSNPNSDFNSGARYPTEYRTELFYPRYYSQRRPQPQGLPTTITYGGPAFNVQLQSNDMSNDISMVNKTTVVLIRTGFSTHSMNMGQRYIELPTSYSAFQANNTAILHVAQLPPNPAVLAPGPALLFIVVNGVPSVGVQVMVGSGQIGQQQTLPSTSLPSSQVFASATKENKKSGSEDLDGQRIPVLMMTLSVAAALWLVI